MCSGDADGLFEECSRSFCSPPLLEHAKDMSFKGVSPVREIVQVDEVVDKNCNNFSGSGFRAGRYVPRVIRASTIESIKVQ